jgi:hypothetical protein
LLSSNDKVSCEQCDRSWGTTATGDDVKSNNGLFIRSANCLCRPNTPNVYFYIQPDIASSPVAGANNFSSYEMLISICHLIQKKEFRVRVGQSKVPLALKICNQVKTD